MKQIAAMALAVLLLLTACAPSTPAENDPPAANGGAAVQTPGQEETQTPETPEEPDAPETPVEEPDPRLETIDEILGSMTMEEKVGQLFFVRCPAESAVEDVSAYHLGGYLLFGRDFKDKTAEEVTSAIASYQAAAESDTSIPLLIGVDEEGGTVVRVSSNPNLSPDGKFQSPQHVYAQGGLDAIRADAGKKSELLLSYGINVNFAPVADVSTDPSDFINARAFGQDAQATAEYVKTVVVEMEGAGIGSVLKHFPGYGNNVDTHTGISVDERSMESFETSDLVPFAAGIAAGADSVLVSHNIVNCMDPDLPASLSPEVHRVLREELGFEGVALTDDLAMDAVEAYAEDGSVAVLAVLAGNDMIVSTDYRTQIPLVLEAVAEGTISKAMIDQAVSRVLGWKYDLGLLG